MELDKWASMSYIGIEWPYLCPIVSLRYPARSEELMVRLLFKTLLLTALLSAMSFADLPIRQTLPTGQEYVPGEILVRFQPGVSPMQMARFAGRYRGRMVPSKVEGVMKVYVSPQVNVVGMAQFMRYDGAVMYAEPNGIVHAADYPNDPLYPVDQWNLPKINWLAGVTPYKGKGTVIIAIIDSGIQLNHPDLALKIMQGWDFVNNDADPNDDYFHGTHVAGIASAVTNNAIGVAGVCPNATLLPVKVLGVGGSGTWENVAAGIKYAADQGSHVLNLSLGGSGSAPTTVKDAITYAINKGCVICCAAGNNNSSNPFYPAYYTECIAIGASTSTDGRWSGSNYNAGGNQWVDVAAPGESIKSTYTGSSYQFVSGTSMACPHVAGEAALLYAALTEPDSSTPRSMDVATKIRTLIEANVVNIGNWVLKGRINFGAAALASLESSVSGNVGLSLHMHPESVPVTLQLFETGTSTLIATKVVALSPAGDFSVTFAAAGTFDLRASTPGFGFLGRRVPVTLSRVNPASGLTVTLPNGDATHNGAVDIFDVTQVLLDFGGGSGPSDLTGDSSTDLYDLNAALGYYGQVGQP